MKVAIIQARAGSSRLPGKVLKDLAGMPVLGHVIRRVAAIPGIDAVWCAVPDGASDDRVAEFAERTGARVSRGPEQDVLERYRIAAEASSAEVIMRVTSDCPLLDPGVSGKVLARLVDCGADYVSNVNPRTWPRGLDTEAMTRHVFDRMAREATEAYDREHVTPWLLKTASISRENVALSHKRYVGWRWTLDYEEDLAFMQAVAARLPMPPHEASFNEIRAIVEANPEIAAINAAKE